MSIATSLSSAPYSTPLPLQSSHIQPFLAAYSIINVPQTQQEVIAEAHRDTPQLPLNFFGVSKSVDSNNVQVTDVLADVTTAASRNGASGLEDQSVINSIPQQGSYSIVGNFLRASGIKSLTWSALQYVKAIWTTNTRQQIQDPVCNRYRGCKAQQPRPTHALSEDEPEVDWENPWVEDIADHNTWISDDASKQNIPDYVFEYAPLVHLYSGEQYWPCDMAEHLYHTTPRLNYTPLQSADTHPTLDNLDQLNQWEGGRFIFLTSKDNPEERPPWLGGEKNIPEESHDPNDTFADNDGWVHHPGRTDYNIFSTILEELQAESQLHEDNGFIEIEKKRIQSEFAKLKHSEKKLERRRGGRSDAPAVLIVVDKGQGIVDAFWFFFYSFNLGNVVFNVRFGNHVGDWEHTAIRFHKGKPKAIFFSEHNFGSAYSYEAVEKIGKRPVIYSATGTHAMYATPGAHPYVLPWGILHDQTDRGPLWDPAMNSHTYTYDFHTRDLRASNVTPEAPIGWFHYAGHWGDKIYPLWDRRQYRFAGQYKYVSGPLGPKFKNLGRKKICGGPDKQPCIIKNWLGGEKRLQRLEPNEQDELYEDSN